MFTQKVNKGSRGGVYLVDDSECFTITATYLRSPKFIMYKEDKTPKVDLIYAQTAAGQERESLYNQNLKVYDSEGVSPSLCTYGDKNGKIMEQHTVAYSKSTRDDHIDVRGKVNGEANTISTGDGGGNMSTQNFVVTHYGHKSKEYETHDISPTLKAQSHGHEPMAVEVIENKDEDMNNVGVSYNRKDGVEKEMEQSHCLSSSDWRGLNRNQSQTAVLDTENIRIRKLTPVECERLQAWPSRHTELGRKPDGSVYTLSNTQRYKICGNGVTASVSAEILTSLIPEGDVRVMSLFSGGGGTELALPPRFQVIGHCEFDVHASAVLHYHWPNVPNFHDVTKLVERTDVPEFDLLTFGFPCQSFSIAGLRQGFNDEKGRGNLIYNVFDIIQKHKPKYLLGENVKGLLSHDKGATFEAIMEGLSSCGYDVDFELVNSKHFGVAQNRERVFIFGRRRE